MLLPVQTIIQSKGKLLDISSPVVMGILNATPDSFYNKGQDSDTDGLLRNAEKMLKEGAAILDIGGASTKPGQKLVGPGDELKRILPSVAAIHRRFPDAWLSVDTYNALVAREAVQAGAAIINDVSAGRVDARMLQTVGSLRVPYIAMHMQGIPENMQTDPNYNNVLEEVMEYLRQSIEKCAVAGIQDIIIDPGFGFGKTNEHNFELLRHMRGLRILGRPMLAGLSRKSMICKTLKVDPEFALNGTTALHMAALRQGARILRAHDVKEAVQVVRLYNELRSF